MQYPQSNSPLRDNSRDFTNLIYACTIAICTLITAASVLYLSAKHSSIEQDIASHTPAIPDFVTRIDCSYTCSVHLKGYKKPLYFVLDPSASNSALIRARYDFTVRPATYIERLINKRQSRIRVPADEGHLTPEILKVYSAYMSGLITQTKTTYELFEFNQKHGYPN